MNPRILFAAALALAACAPEFDPASQVGGLRVLAIRAEPPEIAPAPPAGGATEAPDRAALTALVLRPEWAGGGGSSATVVYLACVPVPGDPRPSPCVELASLRDPTAALAQAAAASCEAVPAGADPGVVLAGFEACGRGGCAPATLADGTPLPAPELALPADYGFEALPAGAPELILGLQAVVLAFALDATPDELAEGVAGESCPPASLAARLSELWGVREHVLATKRVRIRGPEAPDAPNRNPAIDGIAAGGSALAAGVPAALAAGTHALTPVLPKDADELHEPYTKRDAAGAPLEAGREEWVYSWFSTAGELEDLRTRSAEAQEWRIGGGTTALLAAVVRDLRGGTAWAVREVAVDP
jgi:hypothetical protein